MSTDMTYQVTRDFAGHSAGAVMRDSDFASPHRAAQLISQRYLTPLASAGMQPTVATLLGATVRKVESLVALVVDTCVLEAALAQETRDSARKTLEKRLEEIGNAQSLN